MFCVNPIVEEDFNVSHVGELNQTFLTGTNSGSLCLTIEISPDHNVEETEIFQVLLSSTDEAVNITNCSALITIEDANESKFIYQLPYAYLPLLSVQIIPVYMLRVIKKVGQASRKTH